jgi:hypothetical protein
VRIHYTFSLLLITPNFGTAAMLEVVELPVSFVRNV